MAVRDDFAAGEVLAAADLNDTFASKLPYSFGTATPSTTDSGFLWYDSNSTPAAPKFWDGAAFQALTSGKILQIVRATDSTNRSTTSSSFVDANISVTITPQKSDSAILLIWSVRLQASFSAPNGTGIVIQITDASNNPVAGGESMSSSAAGNGWTSASISANGLVVAYATPATTSPVTYKGRFSRTAGTANLQNATNTGQLYAIEVSA